MNRKKSIALVLLVVLLLTFTVSGTLAYLFDKTKSIVNTFEPSKVNTEITEEFNKQVKSSIKVTNKKDSIPVYVRVALVGNWQDSQGNVVEAWNGISSYNDTDWGKVGDYYYYKKVLEPGKATENLLDASITTTSKDGLHLVVTVIHQSIQSKPESAVTDAWGVTISNGNVTAASSN